MELIISKGELADLYQVSRPTLAKRIAELGFEKKRRRFNAKEMEAIIQHLGPPPASPQKADETTKAKKSKLENESYEPVAEPARSNVVDQIAGHAAQLSAKDQELFLHFIKTWKHFKQSQ